MRYEFVQVSRSGPLAVVALDRAGKRNAMNAQLLVEPREALREQSRATQVAAVVLTGRGTVFSASADRSAGAGLEGEERAQVFAPIAAHLSALIGQVVLQIVAMPKLVVAAVNGHAAGIGMMVALGCDFRIAADDAQFWMPEIDLGRAISAPAVDTLLAHVGPARTEDIVVTGRRIHAGDMQHWGLLNQVVLGQDVVRSAMDLAHALAARDARATATVKRRANRPLVRLWQAGPPPDAPPR